MWQNNGIVLTIHKSEFKNGCHNVPSGEPELRSVLCETFLSRVNYFNIKNLHSLFDRTDGAGIMPIPLILATVL
jgi:hypothetical protein